MKRAVALHAYRDVQPFAMPEGVVRVAIDPSTLQLATSACPVMREEVYIHGSEPTEYCSLHGGRTASEAPPGSWLSRIFGGDKSKAPEPAPPAAVTGGTDAASVPKPPATHRAAAANEESRPPEEEKKNLFRRIFGIFGGGRRDDGKATPGTPDSQ